MTGVSISPRYQPPIFDEIMVGISAQVKFGIAFCEASGPCLIRVSGNDETLQAIATQNAEAIAAGHSFVIVLQQAYPINFLNTIKLSRT